MNKRSHIHKKADSSASNPVRSQLQSRPKITQAKAQPQKPLTQTQTENQEFQQQKLEATKLELQAKYGTITAEGQERLTVLQAKMSGSLHRRLEYASRFGHNFANIPISRPDAPSQPLVQTKLTIGEPGDKYEQEADRVAAQVVNQIHAPVSGQAGLCQPVLRESVSEEEKELQKKRSLLRGASAGRKKAARVVEASIKQGRGSGQGNAESLREGRVQAFGAMNNRVKMQSYPRGTEMSVMQGASAKTTGMDVFFRMGKSKGGTKRGEKLFQDDVTQMPEQNGRDASAVKKEVLWQRSNEIVSMTPRETEKVSEGRAPLNKIQPTRYNANVNQRVRKPPIKTVLNNVSKKIKKKRTYKKIDKIIGGVESRAKIGPQINRSGSVVESGEAPKAVSLMQKKTGKTFVAGHLVNAEFWGVGRLENLTTLSARGNSNHKKFDEKVKVGCHYLEKAYKAAHEDGVDLERTELPVIEERVRVERGDGMLWGTTLPESAVSKELDCEAELINSEYVRDELRSEGGTKSYNDSIKKVESHLPHAFDGLIFNP
ncbi:MAG: hypothetical protein V7K40_24780 [Nostoc sp.]|uniref:hypothetical protein n=1 Tax=Nostoc sp. TaxID=1180 RepID=UPI002FFC467C